MAGAIGAAMIDAKWCFGVIEMLYARTNSLYRGFVVLHWGRMYDFVLVPA
jgi:hypothetical protein